MDLCLLRWFSSTFNLLRNFKPMELRMLLVGLAVDWPISSKEFLKDKGDSDVFIFISDLFHSRVVYGKWEYLNRHDNEWHTVALTRALTYQYLFRHAIFFKQHQKICFTISLLYWSLWCYFTKDSEEVHFISLYFCLPSFGDCNENQLCKDFCWIKNKQTHSLHISAQWLTS